MNASNETYGPGLGRTFDRNSRSAKMLSKLLKKGVTVEVTITGTVHAHHGQEHGYYEVPLEIKIGQVNDVKAAARPQ